MLNIKRRARNVGALVAITTLAIGTPMAGAAATAYYGQGSSWDANEPGRRLGVYGDSLIMQSTPSLRKLAETRHSALDAWNLPGAAPCDLIPTYGARVAKFRPSRVELAFVGNATTSCMTSRLGGRPPGTLSTALRARIAALYRQDIVRLVQYNASHNITTYLAMSPAMAKGTWHGQMTASLNALYAGLARQEPRWVRANYATYDVMTPNGVYRREVSLNRRSQLLRHQDGTHLAAPLGTTEYAKALLWPLYLEH